MSSTKAGDRGEVNWTSAVNDDDVTDLEGDIIDECQFAPGVEADDLARSAEGGILVPIVPQLLTTQHKPPPLPRAHPRVQLCQIATVIHSLMEGEERELLKLKKKHSTAHLEWIFLLILSPHEFRVAFALTTTCLCSQRE